MKKKIFIAAICLLIFGGAFWFYKWSNSPASTSDAISAGSRDVFGSQIKLTSYSGQYFTTQIPSTMLLKTSTENSSSPTPGLYLFKHSDIGIGDQLGITIGTMQSPSLDEVSAVKLRATQPDRYRKSNLENSPEGAIVFNTTDDFETSIFWSNGSKYAAVVVSGSSLRQAELSNVVGSVIANWQWL